jgi:hypothetical protein
VALGQVFSEYFGFPCQFLFHRLHHTHHHLTSRADTIGQTVADVLSGLKSHPTPRRIRGVGKAQARNHPVSAASGVLFPRR